MVFKLHLNEAVKTTTTKRPKIGWKEVKEETWIKWFKFISQVMPY